MVDKIHYLLPAAVGAAGLSLYAYFEYSTWVKHKKINKTEDDEKVNHRFMLNKAYANTVISQVDVIASSTDTDIRVDKLSEDDVILSLIIRGLRENVKEAESYINRIVESIPDMSVVLITVPKERMMSILGSYSETIHSLSQETGCKINLKCDPESASGSPFFIEIEGPTSEVMFAQKKVKEMLERDPDMSLASKSDSLPKGMTHITSLEKTSSGGNAVVIVSAVNSPSQFWLQIHSLGQYLDVLEREIFEVLSSKDDSTSEVIKPVVGIYIAVPHSKHGKWHRARIVSSESEAGQNNVQNVRAMFVDYGYTERVNLKEVRLLPEEFLQCPFYAVECSLYGVSPLESEEWSKEAIDCFAMITHKSKRIFEAYNKGVIHIQKDNGAKSITSVSLVDPKASLGGKVIAQELVDRGYACWKNDNSEGTKSDSINGDLESSQVNLSELN